ncbi:hypothetical protein QQP08_000299 [Theobroma cacao]|nr:hypothetical protein QQP08_000299 [Theobroma cacao]
MCSSQNECKDKVAQLLSSKNDGLGKNKQKMLISNLWHASSGNNIMYNKVSSSVWGSPSNVISKYSEFSLPHPE